MNDIYRISISSNQVQNVYTKLIEMAQLVDDQIHMGDEAPVLPTSLSTEDIIKARELAQASSQEFGVRMTVNGVPHSLVPDGKVLQDWFRFLRFEIDDDGDGQIDEGSIREELVLPSQSSSFVAQLSGDFQEVYKMYRGSVFKVTIKATGSDPGYGTAFIIDKIPSGKDAQGKDLFTYRLITNSHVVDNENYSALYGRDIKEEKGWQLTAADNNPVYKEEEVKLVGVDPVTDIGVFEVTTTDDYLPFEFGDINHVMGLEEILVIGNTLADGVTGTPGQAKEKIIGGRTYDFPYLQHDARTGGGNSGSPLIYFDRQDLDVNGNPKPKVGGVHFRSRGANEISLAIPVDRVQIAYEKIIANRDRQGVTHSDWGIVLQPLSADQREIPGLSDGLKTGVNITKVYPGSPADQVGLKAGDILVAVDGDEKIVDIINDENYWKIAQFIRDSSPGQRYRLRVYRVDQKMYYEVDLKPQTRFYGRIDTYRTDIKFSVFDITPDFREFHGIPDRVQGVVFSSDGGDFGSLYENGIITHINEIPTPNVEIFRKVYEDLPKGKDFQVTQVHSAWTYDLRNGGPGAVVRHVLSH